MPRCSAPACVMCRYCCYTVSELSVCDMLVYGIVEASHGFVQKQTVGEQRSGWNVRLSGLLVWLFD